MASLLSVRSRRSLSRRRRYRRSNRGAVHRPWTLLLVAILSAEVVLGVGRATNWYRWGPAGSGGRGGETTVPPSGPNLNPYKEPIQGVVASVNYTGASNGYFAALEGTELCEHCPVVPGTDYTFSPPFVGFRFYVNVTNSATRWETLSNFTVTTSGTNHELFALEWVLCCYPLYQDQVLVDGVGFTQGQTLGLGTFVEAPALPNVGPSGFTLYFNATSP